MTFPLSWNWQMGPNLNWTIFNGFANYYTIDEAAANLHASRAARTLLEQQVWLDVKTTYIALEDARARLELTALTVQSAQANLVLAQARYETGRVTPVEVTDAEVNLASARGSEVQARSDYDTALANLWKALGRTSWN